MGGIITNLVANADQFVIGPDEALGTIGTDEIKDPRRRNSLAYNIAAYIRLDKENATEETFVPILLEIRTEQSKFEYRIRAATAKHNKIAEAILHGSMKELRDQTLQSFRTINRKYRDQFLNQSLIHFICQEGYFAMLEFVINPKNHSVFEEEG